MVELATQVKRRRGTTAENEAFTGAEGEITVDLTKKHYVFMTEAHRAEQNWQKHQIFTHKPR